MGILFSPRLYKSVRCLSVTLFFMYIVYLSYLLFFDPGFGRTATTNHFYNIIPFKTIGNYIKYRDYVNTNTFLINIFGNILAFVPMGFFVPILYKVKKAFLKALFFSVVFSLGAEILQFIFSVGSFDIDDIILNTLGGIVGYQIFLVSSFFCFRKGKRGI